MLIKVILAIWDSSTHRVLLQYMEDPILFSLQAILLGILLRQTDGVLEYFVGAFESNNGLYFTS